MGGNRNSMGCGGSDDRNEEVHVECCDRYHGEIYLRCTLPDTDTLVIDVDDGEDGKSPARWDSASVLVQLGLKTPLTETKPWTWDPTKGLITQGGSYLGPARGPIDMINGTNIQYFSLSDEDTWANE